MPKTAEERLEELLEKKDEEIAELEQQLEQAEADTRDVQSRLDYAYNGWGVPGTMKEEKDDERMAVPRLEIRWFQQYKHQLGTTDWSNYRTTYALVYRHYLGHLVYLPIEEVTTNTSARNYKPWEELSMSIPLRMHTHLLHDVVHLGLPAYALTPDGPHRIDDLNFTPSGPDGGLLYTKKKGLEHRREDSLETWTPSRAWRSRYVGSIDPEYKKEK